jgi:hypothetical protein
MVKICILFFFLIIFYEIVNNVCVFSVSQCLTGGNPWVVTYKGKQLGPSALLSDLLQLCPFIHSVSILLCPSV